MLRTTKVAISLPKDDFKRIEEIRKELGVERSAIIDMAIRFWLKSIEEEKMIRQYEQGYQKKPESLEEIKAMERASAEAFEEEGLR
jgi:metal-responsive CopG/Arc/MetJ family transcriptional regulator